jgi:cyclopropane-fatty-acyl-phospholipid synthase
VNGGGPTVASLERHMPARNWAAPPNLDVENLRPHYARTCRLWGQRLATNREAALHLVDEPTYRAWRIWLAGSALNFEEGFSSIYQLLMSKRGAPRRRLTRDALYRDTLSVAGTTYADPPHCRS